MKRRSGFTLIELLVVITIAAIMMAIAVPSFRQFTATQRVKGAAFDFAAALLLARSEAVKRNAPVTLSQATGGWASGWTVTAGAGTLSTQDAAKDVTITPNPNTTTSVSYQNNGRLPGSSTRLRFEFGSPSTTVLRCVTVGADGVPTTTTTSCPLP